jgi:hypothetical protein
MTDPIHYRFERADVPSRRYLFVVSHMRSYSSVLCHILGSHEEINGYAETHQSYHSVADLDQLVNKVGEMTGAPARGRYVLDKILARRLELAPSILARSDIKLLFLLRRAPETLRSLLRMAKAVGHTGRYNEPDSVAQYYASRLEQIEDYARSFGTGAVFLESERLLDATAIVLERVARWLELAKPLATNYRTFRLTGVRGFGDPSPTIMAGRLITDPDERQGTHTTIELPAPALAMAEASYARCREALSRWTTEI